MDVAHVVATWLHTLAMLIVLGYYGILGRFVVPALRRSLDGPSVVTALVAIERRAVPFLVLSTVLFTASGAFLMFVDDQYAGLGMGGSPWTRLILVKHGVVAGIVALGVAVDWLVREADRVVDGAERERLVGRVGLCSEIATGLGALAILLTAVAEAA